MERASSEYHPRETGIRQGCPLSPFFSLIVITAIFKDVQHKPCAITKFRESNVLTSSFNEVLDADDTFVCSANDEAQQEYVQTVEIEGIGSGVRTNRTKKNDKNADRAGVLPSCEFATVVD